MTAAIIWLILWAVIGLGGLWTIFAASWLYTFGALTLEEGGAALLGALVGIILWVGWLVLVVSQVVMHINGIITHINGG